MPPNNECPPGTPEWLCRYTAGEEEKEEAGGAAIGQVLYDLDGNMVGSLMEAGTISKMRGAPPSPTGLYLSTSAGMVPFRAGSYLIDAGMGKLYHVTLNAKGNIIKSGTSTVPSDGGGGGGAGAAGRTQFPSERELEEAQAARTRANIPLDIANTLRDMYLAEIQAGNLSETQATRLFQQSYDAYGAVFSRWQAETQLQQTRGIEQANLQMGRVELLQQQAEATQQAHQARATERGRRGQTISQYILPSSMQGLQGVNLPMMGQMPATQVDLGKLLGPMAPLPEWPGVPDITLPEVPGAPAVPDFPMQPGAPIPQAPDISGLIGQAGMPAI